MSPAVFRTISARFRAFSACPRPGVFLPHFQAITRLAVRARVGRIHRITIARRCTMAYAVESIFVHHGLTPYEPVIHSVAMRWHAALVGLSMAITLGQITRKL